jgi:hypothetical protein
MAKKLPSDVKKRNQVILGIQKAIEATFSESDWKQLGYQTGTHDWIGKHPRLLRSLSWGDADYAGHVLDAIEHILEEDPANLDALLDHPSIQTWLKEKDPAALAQVTGGAPAAVALPPLNVTSKAVESALSDAEVLIGSKGPSSAVDRVHTALHGYLLAVCDTQGIPYNPNPGLTELFKAIRQHHPALKNLGPHGAQILQILQGFASTIHVVNELRNQASVAHPNKDVLGPDEAMLAINATRTMFGYLNSKL